MTATVSTTRRVTLARNGDLLSEPVAFTLE